MENKLDHLKDKMDQTVFTNISFHEKNHQQVLNSIKKKKPAFPLKNKFNAMLSVSVVSVLFIGIVYFVGLQLNLLSGPEMRPADDPKETQNEEAVSIQRNKDAVKKVLELEFTGPDEKLMDVMWNPKYKTIVNGGEENKRLDQYLDERYGSFFTDTGLQSFITAFGGTQYQTFAFNSGHTLRLISATAEQNDNEPHLYTFTAKIGYQKSGGEEETANVEGTAVFYNEGKIEKFQYGNDEGLSEKLRE